MRGCWTRCNSNLDDDSYQTHFLFLFLCFSRNKKHKRLSNTFLFLVLKQEGIGNREQRTRNKKLKTETLPNGPWFHKHFS